MKRLFRQALTSTALAGVLAIGLAGHTPDSHAQDRHSKAALQMEPATMMLGPGFIDFAVHLDAERTILRIAGPDRYGLTLRTDKPSTVTADLLFDARPPHDLEENPDAEAFWDQLPDGQYNYELNIYTTDGERHVKRGHFEVTGGQPRQIEAPMNEGQSSTTEPGWLGRIAGAALDFLVPSAQAGVTHDDFVDVLDTAGDNSTDITLHNTGNPNIALCNNSGAIQVGTGTACSTAVAMHIASTGKVGINTTAPLEILHVVDPNNNFADIRIENTANAYDLATGETTGFRIQQVEPSFFTPFQIEPGAPSNSFRISATGNIGFGTPAPSEAVDVRREAAASRFQLSSFTNTSSEAPQFIQRRARGTVSSPAAPQAFENLGLFSFRGMTPTGNFSGSRATIAAQTTENWSSTANGTRLLFGTTANGTASPTTRMVIDQDGDVIVNGILVHSSSRTVKNDIDQVDPAEVLTRVLELPIASWRYNRDSQNESPKHLSPMAEDFYAAFGLGRNERTLAASDVAGVALAAIQGLKADHDNRLAQKEAELLELRSQIKAVQARISSLERNR